MSTVPLRRARRQQGDVFADPCEPRSRADKLAHEEAHQVRAAVRKVVRASSVS